MGLKKTKAFVKMFVPTIPHDIQVFNDLTQFYCCFVQFLHSSCTNHKANAKIKGFHMDL
jgi:hypothetical protein